MSAQSDKLIKLMESSFSRRKMTLSIIGTFIGLAMFLLFWYLGMVIIGSNFFGWLVTFVGMVLGYICLFLTQYGLTYLYYGEADLDKEFTIRHVMSYANENVMTVIGTPALLIGSAIVIVLATMFLVYVMGLIPIAGPLVNALLTIPLFVVYFLIGIFLIFGLTFLSPIIILEKLSLGDAIRATVNLIRQRLGRIFVQFIYQGFYFLVAAGCITVIFVIVTYIELWIFSAVGKSFNAPPFFMPTEGSEPWGGIGTSTFLIYVFTIFIFSFIFGYIVTVMSGLTFEVYKTVKEGVNLTTAISLSPKDLSKNIRELRDEMRNEF